MRRGGRRGRGGTGTARWTVDEGVAVGDWTGLGEVEEMGEVEVEEMGGEPPI